MKTTTVTTTDTISLFPLLDKFILYTPSYVWTWERWNGSGKDNGCRWRRYMHMTIMFSLLPIFIWSIIYNIYGSYQERDKYCEGYSTAACISINIFLFLFSLLPFLGSSFRLKFFIWDFDFHLWRMDFHNTTTINNTSGNTSPLITNDPNHYVLLSSAAPIIPSSSFSSSSLPHSPSSSSSFIIGKSCILLGDGVMKKNLQFRVNFGLYLFSCTLIGSVLVSGLLISIIGQSPFNASSNTHEVSLLWFVSLIPLSIQVVPDILMHVVTHIYFTECHWNVVRFLKDLKEWRDKGLEDKFSTDQEEDESTSNNVCARYIQMQKYNAKIFKYFEYWIILLVIQFILFAWWTLTIWLATIAHQWPAYYLSWGIFSAINCIVLAIKLLYNLYPAMECATKSDELIKQTENQILELIQHWNKPKYDPTKDQEYTKIMAKVQLLKHLLYLMEKYPCYYTFFGIQVSTANLKTAMTSLLVTNLISTLWGLLLL